MNIITTGVNQHNTPIIVARLHLSFCKIINFPQNGIDCSSTNQTKCIQCPVQGGYYFTSSQSEGRETSPGFWIALTFWLLTIAVAITGLINSVIIIIVLRRSAKATNAAFNYLLIFLADVDCVCAFVTLCSATAEMAILGNWFGPNSSKILYWAHMTILIATTLRSISAFITIVITLERFLMITFPLKATQWFTLRRAKICAVGAFIFANFLSLPRFFSFSLVPNDFRDVPSVSSFELIPVSTEFGKLMYGTLRGIHNQIDFWLPLPTLLVINLLSYRKVTQVANKRRELNRAEKNNIRAVQMFLPVVVFYFLTNISPMVAVFCAIVHKRTYKELSMLVFFSYALNSAINLPIYYHRSTPFRKTTHQLMDQCKRKFGIGKDVVSINKSIAEATKNHATLDVGSGTTSTDVSFSI